MTRRCIHNWFHNQDTSDAGFSIFAISIKTAPTLMTFTGKCPTFVSNTAVETLPPPHKASSETRRF